MKTQILDNGNIAIIADNEERHELAEIYRRPHHWIPRGGTVCARGLTRAAISRRARADRRIDRCTDIQRGQRRHGGLLVSRLSDNRPISGIS